MIVHPVSCAGDTMVLHEQGVDLRKGFKLGDLTGDSFGVSRGDGSPLLMVEAELTTLSGRKKVMDAQGKHLFDIRKERMAWRPTWYASAGSGKERALVVHFNRFPRFSGLATIHWLDPVTMKRERAKLEGKLFGSAATIVGKPDGDKVVLAEMKRERKVGEIIHHRQTYKVTLPRSGVDMALVAAVYICLDEKREQDKGSK